MSELATLAPEVEASLAAAPDQPPPIAPGVQEALVVVARDLRDEIARCEAELGAGATPLLDALARELEQPLAWQQVDRVIHRLVHDVIVDAVRDRGEDASARGARLFALRTVARHDALWPGATARHGCAYDYHGLLAIVRLTALAA